MGEGSWVTFWTVTFFRLWLMPPIGFIVYSVILYCVCVCVWTHWDTGLSGKLMVPLGTEASLSSGSGFKSPALLTPLILLLSVDMDQETVSYLSIVFCFTVCNVSKNQRSSTFSPGTLHTHTTKHPHLTPSRESAVVLRVWLTLV